MGYNFDKETLCSGTRHLRSPFGFSYFGPLWKVVVKLSGIK